MKDNPIHPQKVLLPRGHRHYIQRRAIYDFFECVVTDEEALGMGPFDLVDFSGLSPKILAPLLEKPIKARAVLVAPNTPLPEKPQTQFLTERTLRGWAMGTRLAEFRASGAAGDLCSLRLFWEWPGPRKTGQKDLFSEWLPDLLDLAEYVAGDLLQSIYIEPIPETRGAFVLGTLPGNRVVEISVNQDLPRSLEPLRLIHGYFTKGAMGNMPLYGFENHEGTLVANDRECHREVIDHMDWPGSREWEDFPLRMVGQIFSDQYGAPPLGRQQQYREAIAQTMKTREPAPLGISQTVNPGAIS